jgi:hypothetical protein
MKMIKIISKVIFSFSLITLANAGIIGGPEQKMAAGFFTKKPIQSVVEKEFSIDDAAKCQAVVIKLAASQFKGAIPDNQNVNLPWAIIFEGANYSVNWHIKNGMPKSVYEKILNSYTLQLTQSNSSDQKFIDDCKSKHSVLEPVILKAITDDQPKKEIDKKVTNQKAEPLKEQQPAAKINNSPPPVIKSEQAKEADKKVAIQKNEPLKEQPPAPKIDKVPPPTIKSEQAKDNTIVKPPSTIEWKGLYGCSENLDKNAKFANQFSSLISFSTISGVGTYSKSNNTTSEKFVISIKGNKAEINMEGFSIAQPNIKWFVKTNGDFKDGKLSTVGSMYGADGIKVVRLKCTFEAAQ